MQKIHSMNMVRDMFKMLADNEYNLAWSLIEDFEINGHIVSVRRSQQWKSVIIDNGYVQIGGNTSITVLSENVTFDDPLDYAMWKLAAKKEEQ